MAATMRMAVIASGALWWLASDADAAVARLEILARTIVADGEAFGKAGVYELVKGRLHYAVDPEAASSAPIVDLARAPRDASGEVTFAGDFVLLKPRDIERGNGRLLYGVNNRGSLIMLNMFNDAPWSNVPRSAAEMGQGFLMRQGYTLLWSAWNWDVEPGRDKLQIDLPVATDSGTAIAGAIASEMTTPRPATTLPVAWGGSRGYPPAALAGTRDRLTVRDRPDAVRRPVPRAKWQFVIGPDGRAARPVRVTLEGGFEPGLIYELIYEAKRPRVVGLGLAAIRDAVSFFRYASSDRAGSPNPLSRGGAPRFDAALIYGFSQSARVIQHMLLEGLHLDEAGRPVFDAAFIHAPGAGKGSFNHRFAQTTRHPSQFEDHLYPADFFPFATVKTRDPVTGATASLLDRARQAGPLPKLLILSTATEYWTRAASLLHTDVEGVTDVAPDPHARLYMLAGSQHGAWPEARRIGLQSCSNPLDYRPVARALLLALDRWTSEGRPPPPSSYPTLADGTLGSVATYRARFPPIAGLELPEGNLAPPRLDHGPRFAREGIIDRVPPQGGARFATLVPLPDADGLDAGGIRLPAIAAPLGTQLGWNLSRFARAPVRLDRWQGGFVPFPASEEERRRLGDPRPSLAQRYASEDAFLEVVSEAARGLLSRGLLLAEDETRIVARARRLYRRFAQEHGHDECRLR